MSKLRKKRIRDDTIAVFQVLRGCHRKKRVNLFFQST